MGWLSVYGMEYPASNNGAPTGVNTTTLDATGELIAWVGPVWTPNRGAKNIQKAGFRSHTNVIAGGSDVLLSLRDVDLTAGPIYRPDATDDQTVALTLSTTSGWIMSGNFSAVRAVNHGDLVALVLGFGVSGRLGADTITARNLNQLGNNNRALNGGVASFLSGVWAAETVMPSVLLGFDDGTFGTIGHGSLPFSTFNANSFNSGSATNRRSMRFRPTAPMKIEGIWAYMQVAAGADFNVILYEDGVQRASASVDANAVEAAGGTRHLRILFASEQTLWPDRVYDVDFVPTTVNDITVNYLTVDVASHLQALPGGAAFTMASRTDTGAYTENSDRHMVGGLLLSAIPDYAPSMLVNSGGLVG